ncbi:hypothetical protein GPJ56_005788 [Histomonas meleagridis]|uniref:uncharacterized protein n=1 Tax=Histomonas meleagridis TaxID=135588 RepID=UPI0035598F2E|nr:hypothetical protein GPJ56_005788 [Histomonas meleagridis]KAH0798676.1 hypothetical protein GO595_008541 [Histomonas meleagridis]
MSSNNIVIKSPLPSPQQLITIKESPPPFSFKLITPNFFLPKQWQPFTILFDFVRTVKSLRLSISGVSFETASLIDSQNNMIKPNESFEFGKIESGQYIMNVPIQPYHSGNMLVKGSVHHITVSKSIDFIVADFLDLKLLFSERSMISQLKAFVKKSSNINITIENIEFFSDENDSIQCESEGIPCALSRTVTNALFFLEKKPKFAEIEIKQKEQQTFKIKLGVETIESENMENVEEIVEMDHAPFTIVVPNDYVL